MLLGGNDIMKELDEYLTSEPSPKVGKCRADFTHIQSHTNNPNYRSSNITSPNTLKKFRRPKTNSPFPIDYKSQTPEHFPNPTQADLHLFQNLDIFHSQSKHGKRELGEIGGSHMRDMSEYELLNLINNSKLSCKTTIENNSYIYDHPKQLEPKDPNIYKESESQLPTLPMENKWNKWNKLNKCPKVSAGLPHLFRQKKNKRRVFSSQQPRRSKLIPDEYIHRRKPPMQNNISFKPTQNWGFGAMGQMNSIVRENSNTYNINTNNINNIKGIMPISKKISHIPNNIITKVTNYKHLNKLPKKNINFEDFEVNLRPHPVNTGRQKQLKNIINRINENNKSNLDIEYKYVEGKNILDWRKLPQNESMKTTSNKDNSSFLLTFYAGNQTDVNVNKENKGANDSNIVYQRKYIPKTSARPSSKNVLNADLGQELKMETTQIDTTTDNDTEKFSINSERLNTKGISNNMNFADSVRQMLSNETSITDKISEKKCVIIPFKQRKLENGKMIIKENKENRMMCFGNACSALNTKRYNISQRQRTQNETRPQNPEPSLSALNIHRQNLVLANSKNSK